MYEVLQASHEDILDLPPIRDNRPASPVAKETKEETFGGSLTSSPHGASLYNPAMGNFRIGEPTVIVSDGVRGEREATPVVQYKFVLEGGNADSRLDREQWRKFEWGPTHFYTFDEEGRKTEWIL